MKKLITFENLPLSNGLLNDWDDTAPLFNLNVGFDEDTSLVHLYDNVPAELLFNDTYVYDSSQSQTMINHFRDFALKIKDMCKAPLEIGSNSGIFIEHFDRDKAVAVEPCKNFAERTNNIGIKTYPEYWTVDLAKEIVKNHGKRDMIFSANTISHIQDLDECFNAINECISDNGTVIIESPSFLDVLENKEFDQFYHEHNFYFSVTSMEKILLKYDLFLRDVSYHKDIHGGTNRYFIYKRNLGKSERLVAALEYEKNFGLDDYDKIMIHINKMKKNMEEIKELILNMNIFQKTIVGYGATAKFTQVANMCGLDYTNIQYVLDTTPEKQGKFVPKAKIPILKYNKKFLKNIDYCFLGAWNYKDEIMKKEKKWIDSGGKFITHIPWVHII